MATKRSALVKRAVADGAAAAPSPRFLGFDTSIYPGDQKMQVWKSQSPYVFTGYYLKAPCHSNASWSGSRARLAAMGWGFAVVYVGRQMQGPCSGSPISAALGDRDGQDAVARTMAEGFAPNSVIYLDVEAMDTVTAPVTDYVSKWFSTVLKGGFVPGMYCHVRNSAELRKAALATYPASAPQPVFWVAGGKSHFDPASSTPADSGAAFAGLWQGRLDTAETYGGVKLPLDIDVASMNNPSGVYAAATALTASAVPTAPASSLEGVNQIIQRNLRSFDVTGVVNVRAGYRVAAGQPTGQMAIVVTVVNKNPDLPQQQQLPRRMEGVPVDVRQASPLELLKLSDPAAAQLLASREEFAAPDWDYSFGALTAAAVLAGKAPKPPVPYKPASVPLDAVEDVLTINCHASPDAGWPNLKPFLEGTNSRLTVGMYDFDAQHIRDTFESAVRAKELTMVLDSNPVGPDEHPLRDALAAELGAGLKFAWAAEGSSPDVTGAIFPNAYHIKVAVRDGESMWLSSGNWMNSNQPDIDPVHNAADRSVANRRNREWHVIVNHKGLSSVYEKYLQQDYDSASVLQSAAPVPRAGAAALEFFIEDAAEPFVAEAAKPPREFFAPFVLNQQVVRIQPLLTPDNYAANILPLIQSAEKTFYMQTQYIHAQNSSPAGLLALVRAIQELIAKGVDVRVIVHEREAQGEWIEALRGMKFDTSVIRVQPGIHNKGIVVDSRIAVVGSHNWSGDGVLRNRDASLILYNDAIARYFEGIFLHDWTRLARPYAYKPARVIPAPPGAPAPDGFRRVSLAELLD